MNFRQQFWSYIYKVLLNGEKKEFGREDSQNTAEMTLFLVGSKKKKKKNIEFGGLQGMWYICAQQ